MHISTDPSGPLMGGLAGNQDLQQAINDVIDSKLPPEVRHHALGRCCCSRRAGRHGTGAPQMLIAGRCRV